MFLDIAFWILINPESKVYDFEKKTLYLPLAKHIFNFYGWPLFAYSNYSMLGTV